MLLKFNRQRLKFCYINHPIKVYKPILTTDNVQTSPLSNFGSTVRLNATHHLLGIFLAKEWHWMAYIVQIWH